MLNYDHKLCEPFIGQNRALITNLKEGSVRIMKKLIAVLLCVVMVLMVFTSCTATKKEGDKGAIINMYLSQQVYNFDPVYAYKNDSLLQLSDLLFSSLFYIDENGKVKNELANERLSHGPEVEVIDLPEADDSYHKSF